MKVTTYAQTLHDLSLIKENGLEEVILGHKEFSRLGKLTDEDLKKLSTRAQELNLVRIFEWDILMTEKDFSPLAKKLPQYLDQFDEIRLQDPGALEFILTNTDKKIQWVTENGNHNLVGLKNWEIYIGERLTRLVLSIEIPKASLTDYLKELATPVEILGLGRILLFYTPRSLLSPLVKNSDEPVTKSMLGEETLEALGESEESPHKGFPLIENRHGTFMFHIKEFCLLDYAQELSSLGLGYFRLDLRSTDLATYLPQSISIIQNFSAESFDQFKQDYPQDLMKGFYLVNKTDILFPKLKNSRLVRKDEGYVGEILDVAKGEYAVIQLKGKVKLKVGDKLKFIHPEGKEYIVPVMWLKSSDLTEINEAHENQLVLMNTMNGLWVRGQAYLAI